jgi:ketosteroid isomerase-like protein
MSKLKKRGSLAIVGAVLIGLAGCAVDGGAPATEEPQIDLAAEEQALRQVNVKWLELYRAKDAEGIGALFVEDGWMLSGIEGLSEGRAAIVTTTGEEFEKNPDATTDWGAKQVWVAASGDLAVERGWWTADEDGPGDGEEIKGEYLTVFTKVGGEWKVLADAGAPVEGRADED